MTEEGGGDIGGLSVDDAVDAVLDREPTADRDTVQATLERIAEDGVVSPEGVDAAVADASMTLSNAEGRVEFAAVTFDEVRETAATAPDLDSVTARVATFDSELEALEERTDDLGAQLQSLVEESDDPEEYYALGSEIRQLTADANDVHASAEAFRTDVEEFEQWLTDQSTRFRDLERDVEAIEQSLDTLADDVDVLAGDASESIDQPDDDVATIWFEVTISHRVKHLVIADARAELRALRTWADREGHTVERADEIETRLDEVETRWTALGERLDDVADADWHDRFDDRVTDVEAALDGFEPPIDFAAVQETVGAYRPD